jgi:DNA-binding CsgD family transcriptional regulator
VSTSKALNTNPLSNGPQAVKRTASWRRPPIRGQIPTAMLYGEWLRRERRRAEARDQQLTAQERQIAQLARAGMSNPEIGARLFLSPRTVQYHLGNVFAKLGISYRNQLGLVLPADAVTGLPGAFIPNGRGMLKPGTGARQMPRVSSDPPTVAKTSSLSARVMGCRPAG